MSTPLTTFEATQSVLLHSKTADGRSNPVRSNNTEEVES
jgi:hypothetical protein